MRGIRKFRMEHGADFLLGPPEGRSTEKEEENEELCESGCYVPLLPSGGCLPSALRGTGTGGRSTAVLRQTAQL